MGVANNFRDTPASWPSADRLLNGHHHAVKKPAIQPEDQSVHCPSYNGGVRLLVTKIEQNTIGVRCVTGANFTGLHCFFHWTVKF